MRDYPSNQVKFKTLELLRNIFSSFFTIFTTFFFESVFTFTETFFCFILFSTPRIFINLDFLFFPHELKLHNKRSSLGREGLTLALFVGETIFSHPRPTVFTSIFSTFSTIFHLVFSIFHEFSDRFLGSNCCTMYEYLRAT